MSIGRQDYQDRRDERADRLEQRAAAAEAASAAAYKTAHDIGHNIPMGQPILVGHHSEARHRRDLDKIDRNMHKSVAESEKASYYQDRAEAARSNRTISADDPDAVRKLTDKLTKMQAAQDRDKAMNAHYRKHKTMKGFDGISDEAAAKADAQLAEQDAIPYSTGRHLPVPSYILSNRNAEMNRLKKRLAQLQKVDEMGHVEIPFDGGVLLTNEDVNRVQILFDDKPDEDTRSLLKSNGFRWSPREGAWQTLRTPQNLRHAKSLLNIQDETPAPKTEQTTTEADQTPSQPEHETDTEPVGQYALPLVD